MTYRFKTMVSALALTFMVLFGTIAFAHADNGRLANPLMSSGRMSPQDKERKEERKEERKQVRRHRRHHRHRRHWRR